MPGFDENVDFSVLDKLAGQFETPEPAPTDTPTPTPPPKTKRERVLDRMKKVKLDIPNDIFDDFERVAGTESGRSHYGKDGKVKRGPVTRSGEQAIGYGQIMPSTAAKYKKYGLDPFDEIDNRAMSAAEFASGSDDPIGRRLAYVGGPASKALTHYKKTGEVPNWRLYPYLPKNKETYRSYVDKSGGFTDYSALDALAGGKTPPTPGVPEVNVANEGPTPIPDHTEEQYQAFEKMFGKKVPRLGQIAQAALGQEMANEAAPGQIAPPTKEQALQAAKNAPAPASMGGVDLSPPRAGAPPDKKPVKDTKGNVYEFAPDQSNLQDGEVRRVRGNVPYIFHPDGKITVEGALVPPDWAKGTTPAKTPLPPDPVLRKAYQQRVQQGIPDSEEFRQYAIKNYAAVKGGFQATLFNPEDQKFLDQLDTARTQVKLGASVPVQTEKLQQAKEEPATTSFGTTLPQPYPNQDFRKTGELKVKGGGVLKYVGNDPTYGVSVDGKERFLDDKGETYLLNTQTGQLEDESLNEKKTSYTVGRVDRSIPLPQARDIIGRQVANQIAAQYDLNADDTFKAVMKGGVTKVGTLVPADAGEVYKTGADIRKPQSPMFQRLGEQSAAPSIDTNTFAFTQAQLRDLVAEVKAKEAGREQFVLDAIKRGAIPPDASDEQIRGLFKDTGEQIDVDQLRKNPAFYQATKQGEQVGLNTQRIADQFRGIGFDDYEAQVIARTQAGTVSKEAGERELAAYRQTLEEAKAKNAGLLTINPVQITGTGRAAAMAGGLEPETKEKVQERFNYWTQKQLAADLQKYGSFTQYRAETAKADAEEKARQERMKNAGWLEYLGKGMTTFALSTAKGAVSGAGSFLEGFPTWTKPVADYIDSVFGTKSGKIDDNAMYRVGKAIKDWADSTFKTNPDYEKSRFGTYGQAFGSSLGFMPAAVGGPLGIALFSTMQMTGDSRDQSLQEGATEAQANAFARLNGGLFGWTEILGVGESWQRLVAGEFGATWKKIAIDALKEAADEVFANEGIQEPGENLLARITYDPNRDWDKGVAEGLEAAGATAAMSSLLVSALLHVKHGFRVRQQAKTDLASGGPAIRDWGEQGFTVYGKRLDVTDDIKPLVERHRELQKEIEQGLTDLEQYQERQKGKPGIRQQMRTARDIQTEILKLVAEQRTIAAGIEQLSGIPKPGILEEKEKAEQAVEAARTGPLAETPEERADVQRILEQGGEPAPAVVRGMDFGDEPPGAGVAVTPEPTPSAPAAPGEAAGAPPPATEGLPTERADARPPMPVNIVGQTATLADGSEGRIVDVRGGEVIMDHQPRKVGTSVLYGRRSAFPLDQVTFEGRKLSEYAPAAPETPQGQQTPKTEGSSIPIAPERPPIDTSVAEQRRKDGKYTYEGTEYTRNTHDVFENAPKGDKGRVQFSNNEEPEFQYALIEKKDLTPADLGGNPNPQHFLPEAQPKDRSGRGSATASDNIAKNIDLDKVGHNQVAFLGAPVVNARGEVIQGNNRSEGIIKSYGLGDSYKQQLTEKAGNFGFSPEQVSGMSEPVLVRVVNASDEDAIRLGNYDVKDLESGGGIRLNPVATAARIPYQIQAQFIRDVFRGVEPDTTLNQALRSNIDRIGKELHAYLTQEQIESLFKKNSYEPTPTGLEDLTGLFQQFLFTKGHPQLADAFAALPYITQQGLTTAIPQIFAVPAKDTLVPDIQNAILAAVQFMESESKTPRFEDWASQPDMFTGKLAPQEIYTPLELALAKILRYAKAMKDVRDPITRYADKVNGKAATMFEGAIEPVSKAAAVRSVFDVEYKESTKYATDDEAAPASDTAVGAGEADQGQEAAAAPAETAPAAQTETGAEPNAAEGAAGTETNVQSPEGEVSLTASQEAMAGTAKIEGETWQGSIGVNEDGIGATIYRRDADGTYVIRTYDMDADKLIAKQTLERRHPSYTHAIQRAYEMRDGKYVAREELSDVYKAWLQEMGREDSVPARDIFTERTGDSPFKAPVETPATPAEEPTETAPEPNLDDVFDDIMGEEFGKPETAAAPETITTPGTNIKWSDVRGWIDGLDEIMGRHISSTRGKQEDDHWQALAEHPEVVEAVKDKDLLAELRDRTDKKRGPANQPSRALVTPIYDAISRAENALGKAAETNKPHETISPLDTPEKRAEMEAAAKAARDEENPDHVPEDLELERNRVVFGEELGSGLTTLTSGYYDKDHPEIVKAAKAITDRRDDIEAKGGHALDLAGDAFAAITAYANDKVLGLAPGRDPHEAGKALSPGARRLYDGIPDFSFKKDFEASLNAIGTETNGIVEADTTYAPDEQPYEGPRMTTPEVAVKIAERFASAEGFENIDAARKFVGELLGRKIEPGTADAKMVDEAVELGVVLYARAIVRLGTGPEEAVVWMRYNRLVRLYNELQPNLAVRTSTSVEQQAYSTPAPLAYIASRLAGITPGIRVYEPTAGNGILLMETTHSADGNVYANELNPDRQEALRSQGFATFGVDATIYKPDGGSYPFDVVIANPPFGTVKVGDVEQTWPLTPTYQTNQIDHAIAIQALRVLRDDGRAVLIVGGVKGESEESRRNGYQGQAKRAFYKTLYDAYNVTDHFTVSGDLYKKQGAGFPVDVIVIDGRGKASRSMPAVDLPKLYKSWEDLKEKLAYGNDVRTEGADQRGQADGMDAGERPADTGGGRDSGATGAKTGPQSVQDVLGEPDRTSGKRGGKSAGSSGLSNRGPKGQSTVGGRDFSDASEHGENGDRGQSGNPSEAGGTRSGDRSAGGNEAGQTGGATVPGNRSGELAGGDSTVTEAGPTMSLDEAIDTLDDLFSIVPEEGTPKPEKAFDPEIYAKAKPAFQAAYEHFKDKASDVEGVMRELIRYLHRVKGWTREKLENARQYIARFVKDVTDALKNKAEEPKAEEPQTKTDRAGISPELAATATQIPYRPSSAGQAMETLVPANMYTNLMNSLDALEEKVGNIDAYVAKKLGYAATSDIFEYFGGEQIDAIALAINNIEDGKALILGDQTGVGKGRVVAGVLKWAMLNGNTPIFFTEKDNLYKDIYRDLIDIGMDDIRPLMVDANKSIALNDEKTVWLKTPSTHNQALTAMMNRGQIDPKYNIIFATYYGLQLPNARRDFLARFSRDNIVVMDESHNAGGDGSPPRMKDGQIVLNRAMVARDIVHHSQGMLFSSATWAKRPNVMSLYAKTDMRLAVDDIEALAPAIERGGVPLQQAVASMLAESGQYLRRERDFDGITYDTVPVEVDKDKTEELAEAIRNIYQFSGAVQEAIANGGEIVNELAAQGEAILKNPAINIEATNFAQTMHNVISQMLLGLKADPAVQEAINDLKADKKVVLTLANTMGSIIEETAREEGWTPGDAVRIDFGNVLLRYLERMRKITVGSAFGDKTTIRLTDEQLGEDLLRQYTRVKRLIQGRDWSSLPASPIDYMISKLEAAGYKVGEITGRTHALAYAPDGTITYRMRSGKDKSVQGKNNTIMNFNGGSHERGLSDEQLAALPNEKGDIDVMIINQSGSTGLSLHSSLKFKDRRQRVMILAQAEANIDTHMQMLGRVNRTGQIVKPGYKQLAADIPAEKRPAAVLAKKMASLNANTTAAVDSAVKAKETLDFINMYGDQVVAQYLTDNPDVHEALGEPLPMENGGLKVEDAARKATGRLPMIPRAMQEEFYEAVEGMYNAYIDQLNQLGENRLEAQTLPLEAVTLTRTKVFDGKGGDSPFERPAYMEEVESKRLSKPRSSEEVKGILQNTLDAPETSNFEDLQRIGRDRTRELFAQFQADINPYIESELDKHSDSDKIATTRTRLEGLKARLRYAMQTAFLGQTVQAKFDEETYYGVISNIRKMGRSKTPLALGDYEFTLLTTDATRQIHIPASQIFTSVLPAPSGQAHTVEITARRDQPAGFMNTTLPILKAFDEGQSNRTERRRIITGNILAGYAKFAGGRVINFTTKDGQIRQGILMPARFNLETALRDMPVRFANNDQVAEFLSEGDRIVESQNGDVRVSARNGDAMIRVPGTKAQGGRYFLNRNITNAAGRDFTRRGSDMVLHIGYDSDLLKRVLTAFNGMGLTFQTNVFKPAARNITGEQLAETEIIAQPSDHNSAAEDAAKARVADMEAKSPFEKTSFGHTRTGEKMFVARVKDDYQYQNPEFRTWTNEARLNNGYYSTFEQNGAIRGFLFKNEEDRDNFVKDIADADNSMHSIYDAFDRNAYDERRSIPRPDDDLEMHSLIGEAGASNMPDARGRMQNLMIAKAMEDSGNQDERRIWLATGWEKGKDGKWRTEIDDERAQLTSRGKQLFDVRHLGDILNFPELYKAYPEFRKIQVMLSPQLGNAKGLMGQTSDGVTYIKVASYLGADDRLSTLLHEIQHAIQHREGFAVGGSNRTASAQVAMKRGGFESETDLNQRIAEIQAQIHGLYDTKGGQELPAIRGEEKLARWRELQRELIKLTRIDVGTVYQTYRAIAGEVEARNVQYRHGLTAYERQQNQPSLTEDTHRDRQIVITDSQMAAMALNEMHSAVDDALQEEEDRRNAVRIIKGWSLAQVAAEASIQRTNDRIKLNLAAMELLRRAFEQVDLNEGRREAGATETYPSFLGVFSTPARVAKARAVLEDTARKADASGRVDTAKIFRDFASEIKTASSVNSTGATVFYVMDKKLPQELFHQKAYVASLGQSLTNRHERPGLLDNSDQFKKADEVFFSKQPEYSVENIMLTRHIPFEQAKKLRAAIVREEIAAWVAEGSWEEIGLNEDEAMRYLLDFMKSFGDKVYSDAKRAGVPTAQAEQAKNDALQQFAEIDYAKEAIQAIIGPQAATPGIGTDNAAGAGDTGGGGQRGPTGGAEEGGQGDAGDGRSERFGRLPEGFEPGTDVTPEPDAGRYAGVRANPGVRGRFDMASLPYTLRAAGIAANDIIYTVFSDQAAQAEAERFLNQHGYDGAYARLMDPNDISSPDVHHAIVAFTIQKVLQDESVRIEDTNPKQAAELLEMALKLGKSMSMRMTRAGRFIRAAGVLVKNVAGVLATAEAVYQEKYGLSANLPEAVKQKIKDMATRSESNFAEYESLQKQLKAAQAEIARLKQAFADAQKDPSGAKTPAGRSIFARASSDVMRSRRSYVNEVKVRNHAGVEAAIQRLQSRALIRSQFVVNEAGVEDSTMMSVFDEPNLPKDLLNDFAQVGAEILLEGLAAKERMRPGDFDDAIKALFGDAVIPHLDAIHRESLRQRNEWMAELAKEKEVQKIIRDFGDDISDEEIEAILQERADDLKRRAAIMRLHNYRAEKGRKVDELTRLEQRIAELAPNPAAAAAATEMIHNKPSAHELYRTLEALGFTGAEARDAFREGSETLEKVKLIVAKEIEDEKEEIRQRIDAEQSDLTDLQELVAKARVRARESQVEIQKELKRISTGELKYYGALAMEALNTPRAIMASSDLSFLLRQGGWFMFARPTRQKMALTAMLDAFGEKIGKVGYDRAMEAMEQNPYYQLAVRSGIDFAGLGKHGEFSITKGEEEFRNNIFGMIANATEGSAWHKVNAARVPNAVIKKSDELYTAFLDAQRLATFADTAEFFQNTLHLSFEQNPREFKALAEYINDATGRSSVGSGKTANLLMNLPLFAPRFTVSRFKLMYKSTIGLPFLPPATRKVVMKDALKVYLVTGSLVGLAWMAGMSAGLDWDDDDFLKIQIGDNHIDPFFGMQQNLRPILRLTALAVRAATGYPRENIKLTREKKNDKGEVIGSETYADEVKTTLFDLRYGVLFPWIRRKMSPVPSLVIDRLMGEDAVGQPFNWTNALVSRSVPLAIADVTKAIMTGDPTNMALSTATILGVGYSMYPDRKEVTRTDAERLAQKINAMRSDQKVKDQEQRDLDKKLNDMRAAVRSQDPQKAADAKAELEAMDDRGEISTADKNRILKGQSDTLFLSQIRTMPEDGLRLVRSVGDAGERQTIDDLLAKRQAAADKKKARAEARERVFGESTPKPEKPAKSLAEQIKPANVDDALVLYEQYASKVTSEQRFELRQAVKQKVLNSNEKGTLTRKNYDAAKKILGDDIQFPFREVKRLPKTRSEALKGLETVY